LQVFGGNRSVLVQHYRQRIGADQLLALDAKELGERRVDMGEQAVTDNEDPRLSPDFS
jgi:hypothetical protein